MRACCVAEDVHRLSQPCPDRDFLFISSVFAFNFPGIVPWPRLTKAIASAFSPLLEADIRDTDQRGEVAHRRRPGKVDKLVPGDQHVGRVTGHDQSSGLSAVLASPVDARDRRRQVRARRRRRLGKSPPPAPTMVARHSATAAATPSVPQPSRTIAANRFRERQQERPKAIITMPQAAQNRVAATVSSGACPSSAASGQRDRKRPWRN